MDYERMIEMVQSVSKEDIKKIIFEIDQDAYHRVKEMEIEDDTKKVIIDILRYRAFFDMLLVNSLK